MQKKGFLSYLINLTVLFLFFMALANTAAAAAFTAEMIEVLNNKTQRSKFYLQDHLYRMDVIEDGTQIAIIVNRNTGKTHVVNFSEKTFLIINNNDPISLIKNPFEAHQHMVKSYVASSAGTEKIQDIMCNKQEIKSDGKIAVTAWISLKYNFPIKIVYHLNNNTALINKIVNGPVDTALFQIPSGFTKHIAAKPEQTAPKKKPAITGTEKAKAPVGKRLGPGGKIIVKVRPEKHITLILISESRDAADIFVNASNNGKPVTTAFLKKNISFKKMLDKKEYAFENKLNPDTIEVKVIKGLVRVIVNQESTQWAKEKSREMFIREVWTRSFSTDPKKKLVCDITADSQDHPQSKIKVSFFKGKYCNDSVFTETITLKNGQKKRYSFPPGNGIASGQIEVKKGDVQFILYPPSAVVEEEATPAKTDKKKSTPAKTIKKDDMGEEKPLSVIEYPGTATVKGPETAPEGSSFNVDWQGPNSRNDFIAIAKKGSHDAKHDEYTYTKKGNPAVITAPGEPGDYELRYVHSHSKKVIGRIDIKITPVKASVEVPAPVKVGTEFNITWQGPGNKNDFITLSRPGEHVSQHLARVTIKQENPVSIQAPGKPGEYEIRYVLFQDRKILATAPLKVEAVSASVIAPESADIGSKIKVSWQGPGNKNDFITLSRPGEHVSQHLARVTIKQENPVSIQAPGKPGEYEIRYVLFQDRKILATAPITLKPVTAEIIAPATVKAGAYFHVEWKGPGGSDDFLTIALPSQAPNMQVVTVYLYKGNPLKMRAPKKPGTYEVRYILFQGRKLLGKATIQVVP